MQQYNSIKGKYPDAILLFRVGDFYETFAQDAIITSQVLGIVLTRRANGSASHVELAGFPYHALDTYLPKLVRSGHRVAICEQLEDPKKAKTIVQRGVTELVSPGLATGDKMLDAKSNNYLAACHINKETVGLSFLDLSTGEFAVAEGNRELAEKLLHSFQPSEILLAKPQQKQFKAFFGDRFNLFAMDDWVFTSDHTRQLLLKHFGTTTLKGFGIEEMESGVIAGGACIHYLADTEHSHLAHIRSIARITEDQYVWLDRFTIRNLELVQPTMEGGRSLLDVLDHTTTPMGTRLLKRWILMPLKDINRIQSRLNRTEQLIKDRDTAIALAAELKLVGDLERLISKVSMLKINPREVLQLARSLEAAATIRGLLEASGLSDFQSLSDRIHPSEKVCDRIFRELEEEAPVHVSKGGLIRAGIDHELDELRTISRKGKDYLAGIQQEETERTGISSLKIGFNNVFGYYLEVTNKHKDKVPDDWIRKQTLTNAERYITPVLKEYEAKILGAEEKILAIEQRLYDALINDLQEYVAPVLNNAAVVAELDCLLNFAEIAIQFNYHKPELNEGYALHLTGSRHPVIEQQLPLGEQFVPNDIVLDPDDQQLIILTGPNMSGKSALLRQTALNVLMAQMGSFVPAQSASIGLVDKVFTRVGASDNISSGESTFMVEMTETASIMNNLSARSLVILDEIGRGTSTYDGISIAWSLCEYIHQHATAKTLFATHYHELNELEQRFERIKNFHISTKQSGQKVIFLRTLKKGGSLHSFGIHVARMAGMPKEVVQRADRILQELEQQQIGKDLQKQVKQIKDQTYQLNIFGMEDPIMQSIRKKLSETDINALSPIEALLLLKELQDLINS